MTLLPDIPVQTSNKEPLYNIGVVTRMTGISMATLRAWERRYDFPQSGRTTGGHRLYSEMDIFRLRWVKERIEQGMQTAQAIQALRYQEQTSQFSPEPLAQIENPEKIGHLSTAIDTFQSRLIQSLVQRDLNHSDLILGETLAASTPEMLILNVIGPALAEVGNAWEQGKINVATEHMATNYLRQKLLMWMVSGAPPMNRPPLVLACAPDEWHEGSLLILGALLRRRRWPVVYLGQAVPLPDLANFVRDTRPAMIVLVAMTENAASNLVDWPQHLPEAASTGKPMVTYGGRVFVKNPEWQARMPGVYLGSTMQQGLDAIERLLQ